MDDHRAIDTIVPFGEADRHFRDTRRVVFSVLYNETEAFLELLVKNFLGFTGPESILVVNLPAGREIARRPGDGTGRVFIFSGAIRRQKFGHTLLSGHIESFAYAAGMLGRFDFFCPLASNSLLGRRFSLPEAAARLADTHHAAHVPLDQLPDSWWWGFIKRTPRLVAYMREQWNLRTICGSQIEGLFASRADWALLHDAFPQILEFGGLVDPDAAPALEEVLPATFFTNFGSGHYTHVCHLLWRPGHAGRVGIDDLLGMQDSYAAHVCALKWFDRSADDLAAVAVSQGWSQKLIVGLGDSLAAGDAERLLSQRMVIEAMVAALRRHEIPVPWGPGDGQAPPAPQLDLDRSITASRQLVVLGERTTPAGEPAFYLFMEETGHELRLTLSVGQAGGRLSIASDRLGARQDEPASEPVLEGYLYMSLPTAPNGRIVRLTVPLPATADQERTSQHVVMRSGHRHARTGPWHVSDADGRRCCYFQPPAVLDGEEAWFGIPLFSPCRIEAALDLV